MSPQLNIPSGKISLGYRIMKLNAGRKIMDPEAVQYIERYREILNGLQVRVDSFLKPLSEDSMAAVLGKSRPLMDELAAEQESMDLFDLYTPIHAMCYLVCQKMRPAKVIETGVEKGGSTYMSLSALEKNGNGELLSVELRKWYVYAKRPQCRIGPLVTEKLRPRWHLIQGDAQAILGDVLEKVSGPVEVFMALQGHTYEVQKHEGEAAWPMIRPGGVFVLDRPDWNDGRYLREFLDAHGDEVAHHETFKEGNKGDAFDFSVIVKK